MPILKLERDDEDRELALEVDHLLSLSFDERWKMMSEESKRIAKVLIESGQSEPDALIKRA